jgi:hypothetical protein
LKIEFCHVPEWAFIRPIIRNVYIFWHEVYIMCMYVGVTREINYKISRDVVKYKA